MATLSKDLRAMPIWLLRDYLLQVGGQEQADGTIQGAGWQARLTQLEDFQIGSLRVGEVRLEITGDDGALAAVWMALEPKLMRAGG